MDWIKISNEPTITGKYLVGHGGHAELIHFLADDKDWVHTAKTGWQKDPRSFGATHWAEVSDVPRSDEPRQTLTSLPKGAVIIVSRDCYANKRRYGTYNTVVQKKWGPFTWNVKARLPRYDSTPVTLKKGTRGIVLRTDVVKGVYTYHVLIDSEGNKAHGKVVVFTERTGYNFYPEADHFFERSRRGIVHSTYNGDRLLDPEAY